MPLLPSEPNCFPGNLLADANLPQVGERSWWVLHTRPRQEKSLARQLLEARIPFYLPLISRRKRSQNRTLTSFNPLFDGYVFLLANRDERITALATARIVRSLSVTNQEGLHRDLVQVHRLIESGEPIIPEDRLAPGMVVEIQQGPLKGLLGKIVRGASGRRFVVEVDFIRRGVSVLLDEFALVQVEADEKTLAAGEMLMGTRPSFQPG
jgi:transcription antitermination factor NusG